MLKSFIMMAILVITSGCAILDKKDDRIYIETEDGTYVFMRKHTDEAGGSEKVSIMTYERTLPTSLSNLDDMPENVKEELRDTFSSVSGFQDDSRIASISRCGVFMLPDIPDMPPLPETNSVLEQSNEKALGLLGTYIQLLREWGFKSHQAIRDAHYDYLERCLEG